MRLNPCHADMNKGYIHKIQIVKSMVSMVSHVLRRLDKDRVELLLVLLVLLLGFSFNLWIFSKDWLITGIDGPYYLIQVRGLLTNGELIYGDPPLTFLLLTPFCLLVGDLMTGVEVGVSFLCALSTIPAFYLMKRVGKGSLSGFIAMLLFIFSAPHIRMMTDFIKNAIGIGFLLAFLYYLHDLAFSGLRRKSLILAAFFLFLTGLTHILDFGVAILFLALYALWTVIFGINRLSFLKSAGVITTVLCIFVLIASTFFSPLFTDFNKGLSFLSDLASLRRAQPPSPPPPSLGPSPRPGLGPLIPAAPFSLPMIGGWGAILLILSSGAVLSFYAWLKKDRKAALLLAATTSMGSIICFPLIPPQWLGRFLLMLVVPTAIIVSYGLSRANMQIHGADGKSRSLASVASIVLIAICLAFFIIQAVNTATTVRPTISYEGYLDLVDMKSRIPPNSIVLTEPAVSYWVQYVVDVGRTFPGVLRKYSNALAIFFRDRTPPWLSPASFKAVYVGRIFVLVELLPPSPRR